MCDVRTQKEIVVNVPTNWSIHATIFCKETQKKNRDVIVLYIDDDIQSPIRIRVVLFWIMCALSKREHYISKKKYFELMIIFLWKWKMNFKFYQSIAQKVSYFFVRGKNYSSKTLTPSWLPIIIVCWKKIYFVQEKYCLYRIVSLHEKDDF